MKENRRLVTLILALALLVSAGRAAAEPLVFSAGGRKWQVDLPRGYLAYTGEMGEDSPLLAVTGASVKDMNRYMTGLGCSVCAVYLPSGHQLWLSVTDRSAGLGSAGPDGSLPEYIVKAYFDGTAFSRGPYTVESFGGRDYYLFAKGISIYEGGVNYRISVFYGQYEIMLRWESGTGTRTGEDIETLKAVIRSVQPAN